MAKHTNDVRPEFRQLRRNLIRRAFDFMPPGQYNLRPICKTVQLLYPRLCDDSAFCNHRTDGHKNPEWQHVVRGALNQLKGQHRHISHVDRKWVIKSGESTDATLLPENVNTHQPLAEGAVTRTTSNKYERSRRARAACVAHYGAICAVCEMRFSNVYGKLAQGLIDVHHLRQISEIGVKYQVDPVRDLRPVCPNCHAVIHLRCPPSSIEEVRAMLR